MNSDIIDVSLTPSGAGYRMVIGMPCPRPYKNYIWNTRAIVQVSFDDLPECVQDPIAIMAAQGEKRLSHIDNITGHELKNGRILLTFKGQEYIDAIGAWFGKYYKTAGKRAGDVVAQEKASRV